MMRLQLNTIAIMALQQTSFSWLPWVISAIALITCGVFAFLYWRSRLDQLARNSQLDQAEHQLRQQYQISKYMHETLIITNMSLMVRDCNPAAEKLFGVDRQTMRNQPIHEWYHSLQLTTQRLTVLSALDEHNYWEGELPFAGHTGLIGTCEVVIMPLQSEAGKHVGYVWLGQDITRRKQYIQEIEQANQAMSEVSEAKRQFMANISHELRTPLTAIIGYSDVLHRDILHLHHPRIQANVQNIRRSGVHLLNIINNILDFSRIEADSMLVSNRPFSISKLMYQEVNKVQELIDQNKNTLKVYPPEDFDMIEADDDKIEFMLHAMLENAARYTNQGQIELMVAHEHTSDIDWLRLSVADTGKGMSAEEQLHLFEPFNQGDNSPTRQYGGVGLSMALVQRFCEMMGGRITVASAVGVGSVVVVYLPVTMLESIAPEPIEQSKITDKIMNPAR